LSIKGLEETLDYLEKKIIGKNFNLNTNNILFFEIINRKQQNFIQFQNKIKTKWQEFVNKNRDHFLQKTYTDFFNAHFNEFFIEFLEQFFFLDCHKSLRLITKEKLSSELLLIEYNYYLSGEEELIFQKYGEKLELKEQGLYFHMIYLYQILKSLNIMYKEIIQKPFEITLEGAILNQGGEHNFLHFLVIIKNNREQLYDYYYHMILIYFFKQFKDVPDHIIERLEHGREDLFDFVLKKYSKYEMREKLIGLLYFFYKKCILLKSIRPLLDFFNFVASRVEDSVFSKIDVIKQDYLSNFDYDIEKKTKLIDMFNFLDRNSTLSSTFLANNLPSIESQLNLFSLYRNYYLAAGLETLESGSLLFMPDIFRNKLNNYNSTIKNKNIIDSYSIKTINRFLDYLLTKINSENTDIFFQKIFNKTVSTLNYEFFKTFLRSMNKKLFNILEEDKKERLNALDNHLSFNALVGHISRMLYVLIDKIFLYKSLDKASKNFIDTKGRYIPKNIALRIYELLMFQDMNFSDDLWPYFLISVNKEKIFKIIKEQNIKIQEKYCYEEDDLTRFFITYNFQSSLQGIFLEKWLLTDLIIPCNKFIINIGNSVSDINNKKEIFQILKTYFSKGIQDKQIIKEINKICQELSAFWTETKV
jgi:hypothetical protein